MMPPHLGSEDKLLGLLREHVINALYELAGSSSCQLMWGSDSSIVQLSSTTLMQRKVVTKVLYIQDRATHSQQQRMYWKSWFRIKL